MKMNKEYKGRRVVFILLAAMFCATACGAKSHSADVSAPEDVFNQTMASLQALDLETFNCCTNNYVATHRNWLELPTMKEYRVFNELLQPRFIKGKRYQGNKEFAEKVVENLSWKIEKVREYGHSAEIEVTLTNKDLQDVTGNCMIHILEDMIASDGVRIKGMINDISEMDAKESEYISEIDAVCNYCTLKVTVQAKKQEGNWQILLNDEFINAFMGNYMSETYSEEVEKRLAELEAAYDDKIDQWSDDLSEGAADWGENLLD